MSASRSPKEALLEIWVSSSAWTFLLTPRLCSQPALGIGTTKNAQGAFVMILSFAGVLGLNRPFVPPPDTRWHSMAGLRSPRQRPEECQEQCLAQVWKGCTECRFPTSAARPDSFI